MDTPMIEHILALQTMLIAAGVLTYSLNAEVAGLGVLFGVGFPVVVLLGGVVYAIEAERDTTINSQQQN